MSAQAMVTEFHRAFGVPVGDLADPRVDDERIELRRRLIDEECNEVMDASDGRTSDDLCLACFDYHDVYRVPDIAHLAKELADLVYVVYGWAVEMGVDLDAVLAEVHRSNMSKLGPDGKPVLREDGKVLKGPGYSPADIPTVLAEQASGVRRHSAALDKAYEAVLRAAASGEPLRPFGLADCE